MEHGLCIVDLPIKIVIFHGSIHLPEGSFQIKGVSCGVFQITTFGKKISVSSSEYHRNLGVLNQHDQINRREYYSANIKIGVCLRIGYPQRPQPHSLSSFSRPKKVILKGIPHDSDAPFFSEVTFETERSIPIPQGALLTSVDWLIGAGISGM